MSDENKENLNIKAEETPNDQPVADSPAVGKTKPKRVRPSRAKKPATVQTQTAAPVKTALPKKPVDASDSFIERERKHYEKRMKAEQQSAQNTPETFDASGHDPEARKIARQNNS